MTTAVPRRNFRRDNFLTLTYVCARYKLTAYKKHIRGNNLSIDKRKPRGCAEGPGLGYEATEEAVYDNRYRKYVAT